MRLRKFLLCGLVALAPLGAVRAQNGGDGLRAGAAKEDITPPESKLLHPGDSIRDHLFARAIVVRSGNSCGVLVGLDQGGARNDMVQDALARASQAINCPQENFVLSATHTHSGATGGLGGDPNAKVVADAVVKAVTEANAKLAPARIAFGTGNVYLNVNRDLFDKKWYQGPNPDAGSDKTLAVVALIGQDDLPIGFYMNYAMHPINFYQSGVVSADFPGEASRYIERRYDQKAVAIFSQSASGNQNPLLLGSMFRMYGTRGRQPALADDRYGQPTPASITAAALNMDADVTAQVKTPVKPEEMAAYKRAIAQDSEMVTAEGALIGETAIDTMKNRMPNAAANATIWGGETTFSCPGRDRLDNSAREGTLPPYKDGAPVNIKVGLLRIGNINFVRVNGEVYNDIWMHLKNRAPARETMMVTLANGGANSGYIYSNEAAHHLTFQVIGSRLKPFCAEDNIIDSALKLMDASKR